MSSVRPCHKSAYAPWTCGDATTNAKESMDTNTELVALIAGLPAERLKQLGLTADYRMGDWKISPFVNYARTRRESEDFKQRKHASLAANVQQEPCTAEVLTDFLDYVLSNVVNVFKL